MKNILVLVLSLLIFQIGISQDSKFTLGAVGSLDVYSVKFKTPPPGIYEYVEYDFQNAFSVGVRFEYYFSEKLSLRTGLLYSKKSYTVGYNFRFAQPNDPSVPRKSTFKVGMINVPLLLGYELVSWGELKITPALGMVVYGKLHESEVTVYEDDSERKNELTEPFSPTLSNSQFSAQFNLGFLYPFTDKVFVLFEPFFNYSFSGLNPTIEDGNPIMHGGILSVNYRL